MKTRASSIVVLSIATLTLTQCVIELDENGNVPGTSNPPSTGMAESAAVPYQVKADCLATLRSQVQGRGMRVVSAERGENSYIVDIQVDGVPNLWRCFHDGSRCTGTEYQGEG